MAQYKHVFFDLDHTLWDFEKNAEQLILALFHQFDLKSKGIVDFGVFLSVFIENNEKYWHRYRKGFIKRDEFRYKRMWHSLLAFNIADSKLAHELSSAFLEKFPSQTHLIEHSLELVSYCAQKYSVHVISNGFETIQKRKIFNCGLQPFFTHVITSEKSNSIKPKPEIFEFAQSITNSSKGDCIMIGDALEIDILGAMNFGWDAIYFNPKGLKHKHSPSFEVQSLASIFEIL